MSLKDAVAEAQNVDWKATWTVNLLRTFLAGVVISTLMLLGGMMDSMGLQVFWGPVALPFIFVIAVPIIRLFQNVSFMGWVNLALALMFIWGDPLMYLLHKFVPKAVPLQTYNLINFTTLIYVRNS